MKGTLKEITVSAGLITDELAKFTLLVKKLIEAREIGGAEAMPDETIRAILLGSAGKVQRAVDSMMRSINVYGVGLPELIKKVNLEGSTIEQRVTAFADKHDQAEAPEKRAEASEARRPGIPAAVGGSKRSEGGE